MTDSATSDQLLRRAAVILASSILVLAYAVLLAFGCPSSTENALTSSRVIVSVCSDSHYKYLLPLLIPSGAYYVIANWVGWEYFRYA